MSKQNQVNKGYKLEELLRTYFRRAGYYVIRSVPFVYEGFDVTDIDLWLYCRASSVSREITIVDCKNKKTPQAIERIFWAHGLKLAINATNAIVATTDSRPAVKNFGSEQGVLVLDGSFLARLSKVEQFTPARLSEEEFKLLVNDYLLGKLDGDWRGRLFACKSLVARGLTFDSANEWLLHGRFFVEQVLTKPTQRETALRCFYLICSYLAVALDFLYKELSSLDLAERALAIANGFTYGSKGASGMKRIMNVATALVEQHVVGGGAIAAQVRNSVERELARLPSAVLGEFFAKTEIAKSLFNVAKELEQVAMQWGFSTHAGASVELRSMIFCLLDYWNIDRVLFLTAINGQIDASPTTKSSGTEPTVKAAQSESTNQG